MAAAYSPDSGESGWELALAYPALDVRTGLGRDPTDNEAENIGGITGAMKAELERIAPGDHHILIVDDNSPDGTGRIAAEAMLLVPRLRSPRASTRA